ncbi:PREDICTED: myosin-binding protein 2-like [Camelina sativa]|uniref:Myosin-binding protein 2-like n=1 Tax=Camelina sativa TaxID=90675 RepID=A0ABM0WRL1_CAMSA|nr:PREDICTED: myosin-binding protein 2-like [Camelina sativa]
MTVQGLKGKRFVTRRSRNSLKNHRRGRVSCASLTSISSPEAFDDPTVKSHLTTNPYDVFLRAKDERCSNDDRKGFISHWPKLEKTVSFNEQVNSNTSSEQSFFRNTEENSVRVLEELLKQERAARAAVCVELDKERSAAASAADEAMAMIHRLQDEKAAVEMEARQFQRMVEEKSTFDAEEMVILKDILIRREREKHFLEKEVEAYRHLLVETEDAVECSLTRDMNLTTAKTVKPEHKQHQDSQERRALLVQELDGTVLDMPYREEAENRDKNRDLYKSDSEVAYSRVRDVYMVKDETENISNKKKNLDDSSVSKPKESLGENSSIIVSGIARKLPPLCRPRKKSLSSSGSRRKSMSAVDYERLKIENEVELLRERLKAVQEERAELTRRASLPSLSSKVRVTSEKRGCRRSSIDLHSS